MITKRLPVSWMTGPAIYAVVSLKRWNMPPEKRRSLIGNSELLLIEASVSSSVTLPAPHSGATWPSPSPRRKGYFWMSDTTQSHTKSIRSSASRRGQAVGGGEQNAIDKGISRSHKKKKYKHWNYISCNFRENIHCHHSLNRVHNSACLQGRRGGWHVSCCLHSFWELLQNYPSSLIFSFFFMAVELIYSVVLISAVQ